MNLTSETLVHAVVLAGGQSRRFGQNKLLADYDGAPLVHRSLVAAQAAFPNRVCLVSGAQESELLAAASGLFDRVAHNSQFASGISSSIACGVAKVRGLARAVVILLGDQPLISAACLRELENSWSGSSEDIVATRFAKTLGPPVLFGADYFDQLQGLTGDSGAKQLLRDHARHVTAVDFESAAVDIDTPDDLASLRRSDL